MNITQNYVFILHKLPQSLRQLSETDDLDNDVDELLQEFEAKCQRPILHTVAFY